MRSDPLLTDATVCGRLAVSTHRTDTTLTPSAPTPTLSVAGAAVIGRLQGLPFGGRASCTLVAATLRV
ncbi:MAG: hypothetical protein HW416_2079 [Chloroflexi bacterium]|nr:hypothetical protein [Chloroflexota bacterium]